jgi:sugar lactone lactonase YvrE
MDRRGLFAVACMFALAACSGSGGVSSPGPSGSASPTEEAFVWHPTGVAIAEDGTVYVSGCADHEVFRIDDPAEPTVFAGIIDNGAIDNGFAGDGGPAADAVMSCPIGLDFDREGDLLVVAHGNNRIRRITPDGTITTIVGSGPSAVNTGDYTGDGGKATKAQLQEPVGIGIDAEGNLYIADRDNDVVRKVDRHGIITTVAGTGEGGFSGDAGPATKAMLDDPQDIAIDREGNLFISDSNNERIRRVDRNGIITTVAGTGFAGDSGDGGPAVEAAVNEPDGMVFDAEGNLYIAEYEGHRVRKIAPDGTISTFAGTGEEGDTGDGGPAEEATLTYPADLTFDARGTLYIVDEGGWVRIVAPDGTIDLFAPTPT